MIIGVTGRVASGKTEAMKIFKKIGFVCVCADEIVHDLYKKNGEGSKKIELVFGKKFINDDGSVKRKDLGEAVFNDENKLKLLNNIIHPLVYEEMDFLIRKNSGRNIAIEAVYFDEEFLADFVDKIIWIERPKADIISVLMNERGFAQDLAEKVYQSIGEPSEVDFTINNDSDLVSLRKQIEKFVATC